jgi:hypothetical protein
MSTTEEDGEDDPLIQKIPVDLADAYEQVSYAEHDDAYRMARLRVADDVWHTTPWQVVSGEPARDRSVVAAMATKGGAPPSGVMILDHLNRSDFKEAMETLIARDADIYARLFPIVVFRVHVDWVRWFIDYFREERQPAHRASPTLWPMAVQRLHPSEGELHFIRNLRMGHDYYVFKPANDEMADYWTYLTYPTPNHTSFAPELPADVPLISGMYPFPPRDRGHAKARLPSAFRSAYETARRLGLADRNTWAAETRLARPKTHVTTRPLKDTLAYEVGESFRQASESIGQARQAESFAQLHRATEFLLDKVEDMRLRELNQGRRGRPPSLNLPLY